MLIFLSPCLSIISHVGPCSSRHSSLSSTPLRHPLVPVPLVLDLEPPSQGVQLARPLKTVDGRH